MRAATPSHSYVVRGSWPFPVDMLRHDGSRPASHADRRKIKALSGEFAPDRDSIRNPVEIALVGPNKPNRPAGRASSGRSPATSTTSW